MGMQVYVGPLELLPSERVHVSLRGKSAVQLFERWLVLHTGYGDGAAIRYRCSRRILKGLRLGEIRKG